MNFVRWEALRLLVSSPCSQCPLSAVANQFIHSLWAIYYALHFQITHRLRVKSNSILICITWARAYRARDDRFVWCPGCAISLTLLTASPAAPYATHVPLYHRKWSNHIRLMIAPIPFLSPSRRCKSIRQKQNNIALNRALLFWMPICLGKWARI